MGETSYRGAVHQNQNEATSVSIIFHGGKGEEVGRGGKKFPFMCFSLLAIVWIQL